MHQITDTNYSSCHVVGSMGFAHHLESNQMLFSPPHLGLMGLQAPHRPVFPINYPGKKRNNNETTRYICSRLGIGLSSRIAWIEFHIVRYH